MGTPTVACTLSCLKSLTREKFATVPLQKQETVRNNLGRQSANTAFLNSISYLKRLVINASSICGTGEH